MSSPQIPVASAQNFAAPRQRIGSLALSEFPLNKHQFFRAEVIMREGKPTISISRWKITGAGAQHRTGQAFEFGAHRIGAVTNLLLDMQRVLDVLTSKGGAS